MDDFDAFEFCFGEDDISLETQPRIITPALARPMDSQRHVPRVQSLHQLDSQGRPKQHLDSVGPPMKKFKTDFQTSSSSSIRSVPSNSSALQRPVVEWGMGRSQQMEHWNHGNPLAVPSFPDLPSSLQPDPIDAVSFTSQAAESFQQLRSRPKSRPAPPTGPPKPGAIDGVVRARQPSDSLLVRNLWTQVWRIYGQFSPLLRSLEFSVNSEQHVMRILNGFAPSTMFKYLGILIKIWRFLCDLRVDMHHLSAVQLADCLLEMESASSIKAMRWAYNKLQISCFAAALDPIVDSFLKERNPHDRREALPLPLIILCQWERRVLQSATPDFEVVVLGAFLFLAWSGLRFADLQRTKLSSIRYDKTSLRGIAWRTKTGTNGLPFGFLAKGFLLSWSFQLGRALVESHGFDVFIGAVSGNGLCSPRGGWHSFSSTMDGHDIW